MPHPTPIRHETLHLPVRACGNMLLLVMWVWLMSPLTASSGGMLLLELWCQSSKSSGFFGRQHLVKTVLCWGWSKRIALSVLGPWRRIWGICMEWGLAWKPWTTGSCPMVTMPIDQQGSPCWLPPSPSLLGVGAEVAEPDNGPLAACNPWWRVQIPTSPGKWLTVCCLPGEWFQQRCSAYRVQAGGGSVYVWGAFYSGAKSPLVLPDRHLTDELCRRILRNTLLPLARQHFGNNYRCQDDNAIPHRARVVLDFLQPGCATKMEQPARSPDCNPMEHI